MGVVGFPVRFTGFMAMSIRPLITFIPGRHLRSNSSQKGSDCGVFCLQMTKRTVLSFIQISFRFGSRDHWHVRTIEASPRCLNER